MTTANNQSDYLESSFREKMLEHVFLSKLLQEAWHQRTTVDIKTVAILKPEVDNVGYDLLVECESISRYIQLKSSKSDSKKRTQTVNAKLANKPGGCVIWLFYSEDVDGSVRLKYLFFGKGPTECPDLGDKIGRKPTPNSQGDKPERPNTRVIKKTDFKELSIVELIDKLLKIPKSDQSN